MIKVKLRNKNKPEEFAWVEFYDKWHFTKWLINHYVDSSDILQIIEE